ncbi:unnamed protein product [Heligmosomoides polygyrus]|uniref:E3 ubiquitin-protein ligase listerin n=1 Tax=Heligmosomoides polygyrus TaxID=6339 RepID=A0A183GUW1_HELPZ|nr:unnamed protein product [Heligmosomoides polygyrus]
MWRKNVDRDVEGAEACTICMMTIHSTNHQLPKVKCRQCKNKFHSNCLVLQMVRIEQSDKLPSMSFEFWVKPGHGPVWLRLLSVFSLLTCCLMNVIVNNK